MDDSLDDGLLARCRRVLSPRRMLQRGEVSGALGDLGTFLPDVVALSSVMGSALPAASFVFFSGLWNLVSGCLFDLPLPIQPMHTVVAVALTEGLTYPQLVASGLWLGAMFTLLGGSGSVERARRCIPVCVVRGLQLGLGAQIFRRLPPSRRRGRGRACSPHHPRQGSRSSRPAPAWRLASEPSSPTASTGSSPPSSLRRSHSRCTATESAPPASCCLPSVAPAWRAHCPRRRPWACTARSRPCRLSTRPTGGTLSFAPRCRSFPSRCSTQWLRPPSWRRTARPACHSTACVWRSLPHLTLP